MPSYKISNDATSIQNREYDTLEGVRMPDQDVDEVSQRRQRPASVGTVISLVDAARLTPAPCLPKSTTVHFIPRHVVLNGGSNKASQRVCMFDIIEDVLQLLEENDDGDISVTTVPPRGLQRAFL